MVAALPAGELDGRFGADRGRGVAVPRLGGPARAGARPGEGERALGRARPVGGCAGGGGLSATDPPSGTELWNALVLSVFSPATALAYDGTSVFAADVAGGLYCL